MSAQQWPDPVWPPGYEPPPGFAPRDQTPSGYRTRDETRSGFAPPHPPAPTPRWRAHPPPPDPRRDPRPRTSTRAHRPRAPYAGPPGYGAAPPRWGFPPVAWRRAIVRDAAALDRVDARAPATIAADARGLLVLAVLATGTAVVALAAAAAELHRFRLLLAGRTAVLDGDAVVLSDRLVWSFGAAATVLGALTAAVAVAVLVRLHRRAAYRIDRRPARPSASVATRLLVPGWNLYGAGQVVTETWKSVRDADCQRRWAGVLIPCWWVAWIVNGVLALVTLVRAFGRSNQALADTVELHVALDLTAAVTAALFAMTVVSLRRSVRRRPSTNLWGWSVPPPDSVAANRAARRGSQPMTVSTPESTGVSSSA